MLEEKKLRELPPKAQAYWRAAQEFVAGRKTEWEWIKPGTPEFEAWVDYFAFNQWEPFGLRQIRRGTITGISVPAKWPEWFDPSFAARRPAVDDGIGLQ